MFIGIDDESHLAHTRKFSCHLVKFELSSSKTKISTLLLDFEHTIHREFEIIVFYFVSSFCKNHIRPFVIERMARDIHYKTTSGNAFPKKPRD